MNIQLFIHIFILSIIFIEADDMVSNTCITIEATKMIDCSTIGEYCEVALGTENLYFIDGICLYEFNNGYSGTTSSKEYTCCSLY